MVAGTGWVARADARHQAKQKSAKYSTTVRRKGVHGYKRKNGFRVLMRPRVSDTVAVIHMEWRTTRSRLLRAGCFCYELYKSAVNIRYVQ